MSRAAILVGLVVAAAAVGPFPGSATTVREPFPPPTVPRDTLLSSPRPSLGGLSYGLILGYDQFRDDLLAPLRWSGPEVGLQMAWEGGGAGGRHRASLLIPVSVLEERYGNPGGAMGLEISYRYDRVVRQRFGEGALSVGGRVEMDQHNGLYFSWDEEHVYWLTAYSLAPRVVWRCDGALDGATLALDVPLLALVSRPPRYSEGKRDPMWDPWFHLSGPHRGLTLSGPPHYAALHAGVEWPRRWWGHRVVLSYGLDVSSYDAPARVTTVANRFGLAHLLGS